MAAWARSGGRRSPTRRARWARSCFTAQGDLPLRWAVKASLAPAGYGRFVELTDTQLRAWEASWQAYYDGGAKPTMPLCPGTNSPAPDTRVVVNLPQAATPAAGGTTTVIKEITTVQTVAGPDQGRRRQEGEDVQEGVLHAQGPGEEGRQGQEAGHEAVPPALASGPH